MLDGKAKVEVEKKYIYSFVRKKHLADTRGGISYVLCVCATATILHCLWMCACVDGILSSFLAK